MGMPIDNSCLVDPKKTKSVTLIVYEDPVSLLQTTALGARNH